MKDEYNINLKLKSPYSKAHNQNPLGKQVVETSAKILKSSNIIKKKKKKIVSFLLVIRAS